MIATHPEKETKSRVGVTRSGVVYELFLAALPQGAFTAVDVVALYLHRGAFENALADEDLEQDEILVGVVIPLAVKSYDKSLANGYGTFAWNWAISCILIRCAPPSLLLPSRLPRRARLPPRAMLPPGGFSLETKPLLGSRLSPPAGWHAPLPGRPVACGARATPRSRWESAHGLCGQHPQLPPLPSAGAVSMAGQRHRQAAPGERAAASTGRQV